MQEHKSV